MSQWFFSLAKITTAIWHTSRLNNNITYTYNIKALQLFLFWFQSFTSSFCACTRLVILLKGFLFKFNLFHHYSKLPPIGNRNRDIKKCHILLHVYLSLLLCYIFTGSCIISYVKFLQISHLTAGKLLCCVFFCSPIVSLHVSASILISRQCNLSSIWGIQIF